MMLNEVRRKPEKPRMGKLSCERGWYIDAPESLYISKTMEGVYQLYIGTIMANSIMWDLPSTSPNRA